MPAQEDRRPDIDALRVLAVFLVFLTHSAQVFSPLEDWHIQSADTSRVLGSMTVFLAPWIMPLFMLLAGMSAWFALRKHDAVRFAGARALRVFVPLVVGTLVVVPPQVYLRRLSRGEFDGSFIAFYPRFFDGVYPAGNFSYGHLWFLAYLFTYMLAGLPFFLALRSRAGGRILAELARVAEWPGGTLWLFVPLAAGQILIRPHFPQTTGAVVGDWGTHAWFFPVYLLGFALLQEPRLERAVARDWRTALVPGLLTSAVLVSWAWPGEAFERIPSELSTWHITFWTIFTLSSWSWLVFFVGAARAYVSRSTPLIRYGQSRIYSFYIFHQTVIVLVAYRIVGWRLPLGIRFLLIAGSALVGTLLLIAATARLGRAAPLLGISRRPVTWREARLSLTTGR